jgi:hypothetical protein
MFPGVVHVTVAGLFVQLTPVPPPPPPLIGTQAQAPATQFQLPVQTVRGGFPVQEPLPPLPPPPPELQGPPATPLPLIRYVPN